MYGAQDCYYFRPPTLPDLACLDLPAAFRYFSRSFRQPAEFTVSFTGSLKVRHPSSLDIRCATCGPSMPCCTEHIIKTSTWRSSISLWPA